jgi:hypothetical protein
MTAPFVSRLFIYTAIAAVIAGAAMAPKPMAHASVAAAAPASALS